MTTLLQALRKPIGGTTQIKDVRILLARTSWFVVPLPVLAAYLGSLIVREQTKYYSEEAIKWSLAMFDVRCMSGAPSPRSIDEIGAAIDDYIEDRIAPTDKIELRLAIMAVCAVLEPVFGKQVRVTGWLPGFRVADGKDVLELSGDACPECAVNPSGYKAGDRSNTLRCLNSEDCGWTRA